MKIGCSKEQGSVLVTTIVTCAIIGVILAGYLVWASEHNTMIKRSQAWNRTIPIIEAGLEEALAHLYYFPDTNSRAANGWILSPDKSTHFKRRDISDDSYFYVAISNVSPPTIFSHGYVKAPIHSGQWISRTVRVETKPYPLFPTSLATKEGVDLKGNYILIDSFDSSDPRYSDAERHYDPSKRKDGGNVTCNSGFKDAFNIGNADIWGKVSVGAKVGVGILANGSVGDLAWHAAGKKGIQTDWLTYDAAVEFLPVPDVPTGGNASPGGGTIDGVTYQRVLNTGTYEVPKMTGGTYVSGNVSVIVTEQFDPSKIKLAPEATLRIYCYAPEANITGDIIENPGTAVNFQFWGMPPNEKLTLNGGIQLIALLYAPNAEVTLGGGGGNPVNFQGAVMAKSFRLNGGVNLHYDEALKNFRQAGYVVISWNEI